MYADYGFYLQNYLHQDTGIIPEGKFLFYADQATEKMDYATMGKITPDIATETGVKKCCCAIAEALYKYDSARVNGAAALVASWSNDGESGSFDMSSSEVTQEGVNKKIQQHIRTYLLRYGVLYCGVPVCRT